MEIFSLYPFITQVSAEIGRIPAATATLAFESVRDGNGQWSVQDAGILAPWKSIVIEAAFSSNVEEVFRGVIRTVSADYPNEAGAATVTVECQDDSLRLDRGHRRMAWGASSPTTDRAILAQMLVGKPLVLHPLSGSGMTNLVLNQDGTDITFLQSRAEANGYELVFADGFVYFGKMRVFDSPQPSIMVYAGADTNCISLRITSDGHQPEAVSFDAAPVIGHTTVSAKCMSNIPWMGTTPATSDPSLGDFTWRLTRSGSNDVQTLTAKARKSAIDAAMRVRGEGELDGTLYGHVLKPAQPVGVDGAGDWLDGIYYVDQVNHRFDTTGYFQRFKLMRNAYGNNLLPRSSRSLGGLF